MPSTTARGAQAKARTKRWLERQGYEVGVLEVSRIVYTPRGMIAVKHDQWASDLIAQKADEDAVLFIQVQRLERSSRTRARRQRDFAAHAFARCTRRIIVSWKPFAREPEVIECP